uniref:Uncharacterized protein n=1 Tax=Ditylenchus dipsaci TaxID=166011 RepID=A0A915CND0_9BILA
MNEQASNLSGDSDENSAVSIFDPMTGTGEKVSRSGGQTISVYDSAMEKLSQMENNETDDNKTGPLLSLPMSYEY